MMRWLEKEASDRFLDLVSSINFHSQRIYGTDLVLADYPAREASLKTLDGMWEAIEDVEPEISRLDGDKCEYLKAMLEGIRMIVRVMQGDEVPYTDQIAAMQQIESHMVSDDQIRALSEILEKELTELGYRENGVGAKTLKFLSDYALEPEEVVPTVSRFLAASKERTSRLVFEIPEESEISDVTGVRGVVYNANSGYLGNFKGRLSFNIDRPWSLPTFANILCHEGYPGHHAFYGRWDTLFREGKLPCEAAFYIKNTPTNALFEGVPESGLHILGWDDPEADTPEIAEKDKKIFLAGRKVQDLQRMYQQNGCHMVNVEGASKEDAVSYMMGSGLFQLREAEGACRFFTDATRRTYYNSYYYGRWMVRNAYRLFPEERRQEFFRLTYDRPHTTNTYIKCIAEALGRDWNPYETEGCEKQ